MHEHKTNTRKPHLGKFDHKHNPPSLWGTRAKLFNTQPPTQQNRSIRFENKTPMPSLT